VKVVRFLRTLSKDELLNLSLIVLFFCHLFPMQAILVPHINNITFMSLDEFGKLPEVSPYSILILFLFRAPIPIPVYFTFKRLLHLKGTESYFRGFQISTIIILLSNIFTLFLIPLGIQHFSSFTDLTVGNSTKYVPTIELMNSFNKVILVGILEPILELIRFSFLFYAVKKIKINVNKLILVPVYLVFIYELTCVLSNYFEVFEFLLFNIEPALYNEYASYSMGVMLNTFMLYLWIKNCIDSRNSDVDNKALKKKEIIP
jgi:hypothetical protein